jgi:hypothetical protein
VNAYWAWRHTRSSTSAGFLSAGLMKQLIRPPRGPGSITPGQATYDLRRLREHGLIERIPHTHRYQVTPAGLRHAMFLTRVHDRILRAGLAELTGPDPAPLREAAIYQAAWTPTGFVDTIRSGTMVYEERTGSGTGSQEVHPGI